MGKIYGLTTEINAFWDGITLTHLPVLKKVAESERLSQCFVLLKELQDHYNSKFLQEGEILVCIPGWV